MHFFASRFANPNPQRAAAPTRTFPAMARASDGAAISDAHFLGEGGQGEVWRVTVGGRTFAAKVYFPHTATSPQRTTIERLVRDPVRSPHFLWPSDLIVTNDGSGRFGYLMPLRQPRFRSFNDIVSAAAKIGFGAALQAGVNLAEAFTSLHARGLAYRDINLGNVFIDPTQGDIAICDNDNVGVDLGDVGGVLGTSGFMAPEIERGEAMPSSATDRHSLAVLLFHLLVRHHPLDGTVVENVRCFDTAARLAVYGTRPLYIFDPKDTSNRPSREQRNPLIYRTIYPEILWQAFEKAFTRGLHHPSERVTIGMWRATLMATRDLLVTCTCGASRFADPSGPRPCWKCHTRPASTTFLEIRGGIAGKSTIAVAAGKTLSAQHIGASGSSAAATFVVNPANAKMQGLRNDTSETWSLVVGPGRSATLVPPGKTVACQPDIEIQFGSTTGTFRCV